MQGFNSYVASLSRAQIQTNLANQVPMIKSIVSDKETDNIERLKQHALEELLHMRACVF